MSTSLSSSRITGSSVRWHQSQMGGGGFITGLLQHPHNPARLFARCDVAGVFRTDRGGRDWQARNHGLEEPHAHAVRSIALDPLAPNVLLRASGETRGRHSVGSLHRSTDSGDTWEIVSHEADFFGNGPERMFGETLAFDPLRAGHAAAGAYSTGLWLSADQGRTWRHAGLAGLRICGVAYHPFVKGRLYVASLSDDLLVKSEDPDRIAFFLAHHHDFSRRDSGTLFHSDDDGRTWEPLSTGIGLSELVFDPRDPDHLFATCPSRGVLDSRDGGRTWTRRHHGLPDLRYRSAARDPRNPDTLYIVGLVHPTHRDAPVIPLFRSIDDGKYWNLVGGDRESIISDFPDYITPRHVGWALARVRIDVHDSHTLYLTNWFGVAISRDAGASWTGHHYLGMETTCIENILVDPVRPKRIYYCLADHDPEISDNNGAAYRQLHPDIEDIQSLVSTALAPSPHHPGEFIYARGGKYKGGFQLLRTENDGRRFEVARHWSHPLYIQALAGDLHRSARYFALLDGPVSEGGGMWSSIDAGRTWNRLTNPFPSHVTHLPHQREWIESELLSVVVNQHKNVCGTNQLLCLDPHRPNTLLVGEHTEGLFRSTDAGLSWTSIGVALPFRRQPASVLNVITADPNQPGRFYAGFIHEGLWRTDDDGATWTRIHPLDKDVVFNATSVAVAAAGPAAGRLAVVSEPLFWSRCRSSVLVSDDEGETWLDLQDEKLGAIRWKGVAIEPSTGRIHAVSCGNGAFYFDI